MIPVKLSIEGLYSYRSKQVIDFEKLTKNGLFGIFGKVGSGKSAILDAMMLAIYGKVERLIKSNMNYNVLNLQSDSLLVEFECLAGEASKTPYLFRFELKRKKVFEETNSPKRSVYKKVNGEWQAEENAQPDKIIGMKDEHFSKVVIIPQGKFKQFIEEAGKARTDMLQEIFGLNEYDLSDKIKEFVTESTNLLNQKQGELKNFEAYNEELIKTQKQELADTKNAEIALSQELHQQKQAHESLKELKKKVEELEKLEAEKQILESQAPKIVQLEALVKNYQLAQQKFADLIHQFEQNQAAIQKRKLEIIQNENSVQKIDADLQNAQKSFEDLKQKFDNLDKDKKNLLDLEKVVEIEKEKEKLDKIETSFLESQANSLKNKALHEEGKQKIWQKKQEIEQLKAQKIDIAFLKDLETLNKLQKENKQLHEKTKKQGTDLLAKKDVFVELQHLNPEQIKPEIEKIIEQIKEKCQILEAQKQDLELKQKFALHAHNLKNGEACPLCGSLEHPQPLEAENLDKNVQLLVSESNLLQKKVKDWEKFSSDFYEQLLKYQTLKANFIEKKKDLEAFKEELKKYEQNYTDEFVESAFQKIMEAQKVEKEVQNLEKQSQNLEKELQNLEKQSEENQKQTQDFELKCTSQKSILQTLSDQIENKDFLEKTKPEIVVLISDLEKYIKKVQTNYEKIQAEIREKELEKKGIESFLETNKKELEQEEQKDKNIENDLEKRLQEADFENIEQIKAILEQKINLEKEQQKIQNFRTQKASNQKQLVEIQTQIGEQNFDKAAYEKIIEQISNLEKQQKNSFAQIRILETSIEESEQKIVQKKDLEKDLEKIQKRHDNLADLQKLFVGKGFVEYVSTVYLQNLVAVANERFRILTQHHLSLELDNSNNFIVRDYMNNGKTRLLKTLSGGQTFQAALCLALALADSLKVHNQSEKSFFFLDEGFGTLDKESLQTVFETLQSLHKENRIVGVISHVEELQEEIPAYLVVENQLESGSMIKLYSS